MQETKAMSISKHDLIATIITAALENLADWQAPKPMGGAGPEFPGLHQDFAEQLATLRADLAAALQCYSIEQLASDYPASRTASRNPLFDPHGRHGRLARRLAKLKTAAPGDFDGGWGVEGKEVDVAHWRGFASYSLAEAALLSVGRDPRHTNFHAVFKCYGRSEQADEVLYFLEDRYEAIANAFDLDADDPTAKVNADRFLDWVKDHSVRIDERFRRMLRERQNRSTGAEERPTPAEQIPAQDKPLHGSSRKTHARIILAMARSCYGLEGETNIGKVAKAIQRDGDLLGQNFDAAVVRDLIRAGLEQDLVPDEPARKPSSKSVENPSKSVNPLKNKD
jgi:hypothetical protein